MSGTKTAGDFGCVGFTEDAIEKVKNTNCDTFSEQEANNAHR